MARISSKYLGTSRADSKKLRSNSRSRPGQFRNKSASCRSHTEMRRSMRRRRRRPKAQAISIASPRSVKISRGWRRKVMLSFTVLREWGKVGLFQEVRNADFGGLGEVAALPPPAHGVFPPDGPAVACL